MRKKTYKPFIVFVLLLGILPGKDEILWDLGLVIAPDNKSQPILQQKENKGIKVKLPDHTIYSQVKGLSEKLNIYTEHNEEQPLPKKDSLSKKEPPQPNTTQSLLYNKEETMIESLQKKGSDSFRSGRYKDALEYLMKIDYNEFTQDEQNQITYLKANAHFQLGEYNKAEQHLNPLSTQRFSPDADDALMLLGMIYKKKNDQENAIKTFKQILLDFPDSEFYESARIQTRILSQNK